MEVLAEDRIGLVADITSMISSYSGNITYIQSWIEHNGLIHILVQVDKQSIKEKILLETQKINSVRSVFIRPTYIKTYGKRVIVVGGGAQVALVASGAIAEADRHNIRGETISIDTMPVVGERELSQAVRAVGRLHRVGILVLAGALMGGDITRAVVELRETYGVPVISLRMAGSVTSVCDLVITDPTEAGVMAVMLISHIGQFNLLKIHGRCF
ncbi:MAG: hypothetical protein DRP87_01950 [Spirochaetes bacterium]|nr:MAG: hypothetical protein DRP87_01950 [Spirochaetota bacterium]